MKKLFAALLLISISVLSGPQKVEASINYHDQKVAANDIAVNPFQESAVYHVKAFAVHADVVSVSEPEVVVSHIDYYYRVASVAVVTVPAENCRGPTSFIM